jgi:hypothetical protein
VFRTTTSEKTTKEAPNYEDSISSKFEKKDVLFIEDEETLMALKKYHKIIGALRENDFMTVKELHNLFYDPEAKEHEITIKTVYRHLELLEKSNPPLVTVAGHRTTEGSRLPEKLYARTAKVFFLSFDKKKKKEEYYDSDKGKNMAINTNILIAKLLEKKKADDKEFLEALREFHLLIDEKNSLIFEKTKKDNEIVKLLASNPIEEINYMIETAALLLTLIKDEQAIKKLREAFL